ncbi:MAG: hypothetical protein EAZ95_10245 [Bacteroidetes bacterium]|nr:MAG: hypothetical protein EAZ95_10245 [Bacteroidota bacterium]
MFALYFMKTNPYPFMLHFLSPKRPPIAQCERNSPVFWVMHEIEEDADHVQVNFLDADNQVLQSEKMPYSSPTQREATLKKIEQIRQSWVFKIC